MKRFLDFINENTGPKELHQIGLNKSQLNSLHRHQSFRTYVNSLDHPTVYAKSDEDDSPKKTRKIILTNSGNKHKMHVAITNRGKILGHTIYRKSDNPPKDAKVQWDHVKTVDGA
ncbi:hypothetical protein UFOVP245_214 [uncultured Caudovirales phage]|uniref:Uncharacterized protein n=1 Tax=uncultured Caudovirales phage TaxID=2100421 RepID=A0A6J7X2W7_9CAUD|nr:hypothetical protein UFOVP245_214 [uncultured Caudovirales phage]